MTDKIMKEEGHRGKTKVKNPLKVPIIIEL